MVVAAPQWLTRANVLICAGSLARGPASRAWRITKSLTICICPSDVTRPIFTKVIIVLRTTNSTANLIICPATRTCAVTFTTHATVDSADLFSWITGCDDWAFSSAPLNFSGAARLPLRVGVCCQKINVASYTQNIHHPRRRQGILGLGPLLRIQMMRIEG